MNKVIMVHFGRCGSTVLAKMIDAHSKVIWLHEMYSLIWQSMEDKSEYNFTCRQMIDMLEDAVAKQATSRADLIGVEVKLINFLHSGRCSLHEYAQSLAKKQDWQVVVLRRRNVLARVLSMYRAASSGVYHMATRSQSELLPFTMPTSNLYDPDTGVRGDNLGNFLKNISEREEMAICNLKREMDVTLELWYEDDIRKNPRDAYKKFETTFGLRKESPKITLRRTTNDVYLEILNLDEIANELRETEFMWMVNNLMEA